jgi:predicted O-methyltransferase YrrM
MRYEDISEYVARLVGPGDELQARARRKSVELRKYGVFSIDPTRGRFLELLARLRSPKRVLEIGSGAGYSALWFMKGMSREGTLDAIEVSAEVAKVLEGVMREAGLKDRVKIHHGLALEILRKLKGTWDFVFIDADKDEYPNYLEQALRLTRAGSTIMADNMLWGGSVIRGRSGREGSSGILEYTRRIFADPRLSSIIVPLGDGLAVSFRVK